MRRIAVALWNPIVAKEYRSRMRTWRSPVAMTVYILLLGGLGWAIFSAMSASTHSAFNQGQAASFGQGLFIYLVLFQMVLLAFITPALTAGAISSERERQTIDLLFVTKLPSFSILWGKLLASMSFVLLLLLLSVPIFSLVFFFGGIELDQLAAAFLVTAVAALTLGIIGLACSTAFNRTLPATVADIDPNATNAPAPPAVSYLSPVLPLVTIGTNAPVTWYGVRNSQGYGTSASCASPAYGPTTCVPLGPNGVPIGKGGLIRNPPQPSGTTIPSGLFSGWQYWQASVTMQLLVSLAALVLSALLLPPIRRLPWRKSPVSA